MAAQTLTPLSAPYARRSEQLAAALAALQQNSQSIRGRGELGTRLLADGLLQFADARNEKGLAEARGKERSASLAAALAGIGMGGPEEAESPTFTPAGNGSPNAPTSPAPTPPQMPGVSPSRAPGIEVAALAPPVGPAASPSGGGVDLDGLARALAEQPKPAPKPFASLDEAKATIGVMAPGVQFTSGRRSGPQNAAAGGVPNSDHLTGQALDMVPPPGMDMAGLHAKLRSNPNMPGDILNEGDHVHAEWGRGWRRPPDPQLPDQFPPVPPLQAQGDAPQQTMASGPPMAMAQQAAMPPQQAGGPPSWMAQPPQASAPPPGPQQPPPPQQQFGQPLGPTPQEKAFLARAANDPLLYDQAMAVIQGINARMMAPRKFDTTTVNGVPTWLDPYNPGGMQAGSVPGAAMNRTVSAQEAGVPAPEGTTFTRSPIGSLDQVYAPPSGYQNKGGGLEFVQGGPQDPTAGGNRITNETALRKEYQTGMQEVLAARAGFEKVLAASQGGTGADDIALIFGLMKTLDPTSTVREGEFATAQNSGSVDQTIMNLYNRLMSGERLQPEQRQQFARTAQSQYQVYQRRGDQMTQRYTDLAQRQGFDPRNVVQDYGQPPGLPTQPVQNLPRLSPEQAAKLPPGTRFMGADGVERVRQ